MAISEVALSPPRSARPVLRWIAVIAAAFVLLAVILGAWIYHKAGTALPQLDGTVNVDGLSAPVAVTRDGHGVPTIEAANLEDLFLAQGYVTAQDRLWEMDMTRRFAAGDMAEILGAEWVKNDR